MSDVETTPMGRDERMWGMISHLAAIAGFIGIPLGNIFGPLIVWLIKREQYPFVNDQGKEALNFQISMTIYAAISSILIIVGIGIVLLIAIVVADIILLILASIAANEGRAYRYPVTIRLVK